MSPQETVKSSQYLADNHKVIFGSHCRNIDKITLKKLFSFDACPVSAALNICHPSSVFGGIA